MNHFLEKIKQILGLSRTSNKIISYQQTIEFENIDHQDYSGYRALKNETVSNSKEFEALVIHVHQDNFINHKELMAYVKINLMVLEKLSDYLSYTVLMEELDKVNDLMQQSKTCLQILEYIDTDALFYSQSLDTIKEHSRLIGKFTVYVQDRII